MGNYHHHQNPSAYNLDLVVISNVCDLYAADGLYAIDSTQHSPLLGFAYDGFPIYGAYGYENTNGTGNIVRMKSSYQLRSITVRNTYEDGTSVTSGPNVNPTYPLGYFREDYEYVQNALPDYLDVHNGRFCVTPEYPNGTYAYFCTVNETWNSAYPYAVGPTFYGIRSASKVTSITETVTTYNPNTALSSVNPINISVYPNPATDLIAVQIPGLSTTDFIAELYDLSGKLVLTSTVSQGSTIAYFDVRRIYNGEYVVKIVNAAGSMTRKVVVLHE
jgi:hypothetical protein